MSPFLFDFSFDPDLTGTNPPQEDPPLTVFICIILLCILVLIAVNYAQ